MGQVICEFSVVEWSQLYRSGVIILI